MNMMNVINIMNEINFLHVWRLQVLIYWLNLRNGRKGNNWSGIGWNQKKRLEWRNQNNGTNGIYEIDGASTTDGGIDIHWDDLSDKIDGTYETQ